MQNTEANTSGCVLFGTTLISIDANVVVVCLFTIDFLQGGQNGKLIECMEKLPSA